MSLPPPLPPPTRTIAGARPAFHEAAAIDRLIAMVLALTAEVSVLADRLASVERLAGLPDGAVEAYAPDRAERAARVARREALLGRVLAILEAELGQLERGETREAYWQTIARIEDGAL